MPYFGVYTYFDKTIKCVSKWFIRAYLTQNLQFVNLKHNTQPIWVALNIQLAHLFVSFQPYMSNW